MKKAALCACLSAVLAVSAAQAAPVTTDDGTKSLIFRFQGLSQLDLDGYDGGIGLRYYLKNRLAIRPGIDFGYSSQTTKGTNDYSDAEIRNLSIGGSVVVEKHLTGQRSISPYLGGGVGYKYSRSTSEPSIPPGASPGIIVKHESKNHSYQLLALAGFEWGMTESLTLGGETQFGLSSSGQKKEIERKDEGAHTSQDQTAWELGFTTVAVYLSVGW